MVKILLVGCNGKMGHMISKVASTSETLNIQAGVDMNTESNFNYSIYDSIDKVTEEVDVILDFSRPSSLDSISKYALAHSLPVVFCTTGYTEELLANTIKDSIEDETTLKYGREGISKREHKEIGIHAIRGGNIIGDHEVIFAGMGEVIEIKHSAISREVFAVGALKACEYVHNKPKGIYSMDDVIK